MRTDAAPLPWFFLRAAAALALVMAAWWGVKQWTALPAAWLAKWGAEAVFSDLLRQVDVENGVLVAESYLRPDRGQLPGGQAAPRGMQGVLVAELDPVKYTYGLPLLLALLLAGSRYRLLRQSLLGYLALLPAQALCLALVLAFQVARAVGPSVSAQAGWSRWQVDLLAYGYQISVLLLPTLVPVLLWLWLDRRFFVAVLLEGWLRHAPVREGPPAP
ncbi:exosortase H-associated membrane protein [Pseudorhodoferax sp.]|uniref:exosortase H-associated membrane protein n=1 Tax=Pseudorhodoferax sp. TaxID=1993553 RepID=UPI002DD681C1|nr:exosortase H-associated membrane protein [Pseudorhodoferax sp.]